MLVGGVRRVHGVFDAGLRPGVYVLDIVSVLSLELIEFIDLVLDGTGLPVDPLLTGEGVHFAPEALLRLILQRLAGCVGRVVIGFVGTRAGCSLIWRCLRRGGAGLGEG